MKILLLILGLCFVIAGAMLLIGAPIVLIQPDSFESSVKISVGKQAPPDPSTFGSVMIQTLPEKILSKRNLYPVIRSLNLQREWAKKFKEPDDLKIEMAYVILKAQLSVREIPNTSLVDVRVSSHDPAETAPIANEIAKAFCASAEHNASLVESATTPTLPRRNFKRAALGCAVSAILCLGTGALMLWYSLRRRAGGVLEEGGKA